MAPTGSTALRRLGLNSLWLLAARAAGQLFTIVFTLLVARGLGVTGLGQFAFMASLVYVGNVVTTFGLDTLLMRDVAVSTQAPVNRARLALSAQLVLSLFFIGGIFIWGRWLPNQTATSVRALHLYSLSLLPLAFSTVYSAVLRGHERMDLYFLFSLVPAIVQVAGAYLVLVVQGDLVTVALVLLAAQLAGAVTVSWLGRAFLPPSIWFSPPSKPAGIAMTLRRAWPLAALMILAVLYQRMAVFALSLGLDDRATGWYSAAARVVEAGKMAPYALAGALFPILSRRHLRPHHTAAPSPSPAPVSPALPKTATLVNGRRLLLVLGVAVATAALLNLAAQPVILLLYGRPFIAAVPCLRILAWSLVPFTLSLQQSLALVTAGEERMALAAMLVTTLLAATSLFLTVSWTGLDGTCWVVVAVEGIQAAILWIVSPRSS